MTRTPPASWVVHDGGRAGEPRIPAQTAKSATAEPAPAAQPKPAQQLPEPPMQRPIVSAGAPPTSLEGWRETVSVQFSDQTSGRLVTMRFGTTAPYDVQQPTGVAALMAGVASWWHAHISNETTNYRAPLKDVFGPLR